MLYSAWKSYRPNMGALKSRDLTSRDLTKRHQIKQRDYIFGLLWTSGGISTRLPRHWDSRMLVPLRASHYQAHEQDRPQRSVREWCRRAERRSVFNESSAASTGRNVSAIADVEANVVVDSSHENQLRQLIRYVNRQWINKRFVGPERFSVRENQSRANNVLESYHDHKTTGIIQRI